MLKRTWILHCSAIVGCLAIALGVRADEASKSSSADVGRPSQAVRSDGLGSPSHAERTAAELVGRRVPSFVLKDAAGSVRSLADYSDKRAVVLVFVSTECPIANEYLPVIADLASKQAEQSVQWLAIYSSPSDDAAKIAAHVKQFEIKIPALHDADQQALQATGVDRTAMVVLLDSRRVVRYAGRIDDRFGYDYHRDSPTRNDLAVAIDELLAHKEISVPTTRVQGCRIAGRKPQRPATEVTYCNQVVRILQERCQTCHRPGTVAAVLALGAGRRCALGRHDPRGRARAADAALAGRFAATASSPMTAGCRRRRSTRSWLGSTRERRWATRASCRRLASSPTAGRSAIRMSCSSCRDEVKVPATGTVPYHTSRRRRISRKTFGFKRPKLGPAIAKAVHHIIAFYKEPGSEPGDRRIQDQWIAGTAPGDMALMLPPGVGHEDSRRRDDRWQMHYTPNGKAEGPTARSRADLHKGKDPPKHNVADARRRQSPVLDSGRRRELRSRSRLSRCRATRRSCRFMPHMHLRGKDFTYRGDVSRRARARCCCPCRGYDFNWQSIYRLRRAAASAEGNADRLHRPLRQLGQQPSQPRPDEIDPLGRSDLGRNDDRLRRFLLGRSQRRVTELEPVTPRSTICRPPVTTRNKMRTCDTAVFLLHNLLHMKAEKRLIPAPRNRLQSTPSWRPSSRSGRRYRRRSELASWRWLRRPASMRGLEIINAVSLGIAAIPPTTAPFNRSVNGRVRG